MFINHTRQPLKIVNCIRKEHGQDLVEYALTLPIFLLLIFGVIEFGILFFDYNTIANAAREGARIGVIRTNTDEQIRNAARALTTGLDPDSITVTPDRDRDPNSITVRVTYRAQLITGPVIQALGGTDEILLSTDSTMRLE